MLVSRLMQICSSVQRLQLTARHSPFQDAMILFGVDEDGQFLQGSRGQEDFAGRVVREGGVGKGRSVQRTENQSLQTLQWRLVRY